jgi:hypothetical protein
LPIKLFSVLSTGPEHDPRAGERRPEAKGRVFRTADGASAPLIFLDGTRRRIGWCWWVGGEKA